ncbi:Gfo/Idh/MocA family oxidoreductase [Cupriavidus sp. BIS7]|jgi:phthalate 4,5-cis-dihydrodiol dehydrogenase|uniref:Gfo/Idh/MocA family protein n=1 Tax=Cupriavidus sp. BIS7 TaxID=1217718 RepID=UPI000304E3BB|nr:Gfo/Idh/MocA family oxidoreductase [Cupriavidus sp. BIS7]
MADTRIRLGVIGLGRAFALMLPTLTNDERLSLVAATDPRLEARAQFVRDFGGTAYDSVEALCADDSLEAVYVATPHQMHAEHVCTALRHGKHVLVEKPMAISMEECQAMVEAAEAAGTYLIVGHSHSFDAPVLQARRIIESGLTGAPRMVVAQNYTDFLYRPRRPEELDTAKGGGVIFSQGAHQVEIVRLLCGGMVRSVRAHTGAWDPARPTEGAYSALMEFEEGAFASATYSGYGYYDTDELQGWVGEMGHRKRREDYGMARRNLAHTQSGESEAARKASVTYGGALYQKNSHRRAEAHQHFGHIVVSCERADLRLTPFGVEVFGDAARMLQALPAPYVPRREVIDELWRALREGVRPLHDGRWSMATMEVCLAILASAKTRQEVEMRHQVPVSPICA